jgi:hypothetical protein
MVGSFSPLVLIVEPDVCASDIGTKCTMMVSPTPSLVLSPRQTYPNLAVLRLPAISYELMVISDAFPNLMRTLQVPDNRIDG